MFFGGSTGTTGNPLFQSASNGLNQNSQQQTSAFQFGQSLNSANSNTAIGSSSTGTGGDPFKFGTSSTTPTSNSSFNFGGSSAPTNSTTIGTMGSSLNSGGSFNSSASAPLVTSMATYPFQYIQQCFDPNHLNYRFRTFFYNVADDLTEAQRVAIQTQKPANVNDSMWAQTQNDNPDPLKLIPVLANGFSDLLARARWEDDVIRAHTDKLNELHEKSSKLLRDLDIDLTAKLISAQQRHQALSMRLLKIMKGMEILRRSGSKLTASESQALTKLKTSLSKLNNGPLESGSLHNLTFQLDSLLEAGRLDAFRSAKAIKPANEESASALHSLLEDQQDDLMKIVDSIQKDSSDLQKMKSGYRPL